MGRYCDIGFTSNFFENSLCYNKISNNYKFFIDFDKVYKEVIEKIDYDDISSDIFNLLNVLITHSEGICPDCFIIFIRQYSNGFTTINNKNKIIPNDKFIKLLQEVVPDYVPSSITWTFCSKDTIMCRDIKMDSVLFAFVLNEYEKRIKEEEIDSNYGASEIFDEICEKYENK